MNNPGSQSNSAVAVSTVRLNPSTDPNALSGSPSSALRQRDGQFRIRRRTARIVVLDHRNRRTPKAANDVQAPNQDRASCCKTAPSRSAGEPKRDSPSEPSDHCRTAAVDADSRHNEAEFCDEAKCACSPETRQPDRFTTHEVGDRPVVAGRYAQTHRRQVVRRSSSVVPLQRLKLCQNLAVLFGAGCHCHIRVILCGSSNQAWAANVDLFHTLLACHPGARRGRGERDTDSRRPNRKERSRIPRWHPCGRRDHESPGCRQRSLDDSVLTRPSSISGKPVYSATSITSMPDCSRCRRVPPVL